MGHPRHSHDSELVFTTRTWPGQIGPCAETLMGEDGGRGVDSEIRSQPQPCSHPTPKPQQWRGSTRNNGTGICVWLVIYTLWPWEGREAGAPHQGPEKVRCCELALSPLASSPLLDPIFLTARGSGKQRQAASAPLSLLFSGAVFTSPTY